MAYYYVKNGGTATGDGGRYASQQTGTFAALGAAGYYNDIQDAIDNSTTSPAAGDSILCSDLHSFATTGGISYVGIATDPVRIVAVDDANIDQARTTSNMARESNTGTGGIDLNNVFLSGIELENVNDIRINQDVKAQDSKLIVSTSNASIVSTTDSGHSEFIEVEFALNDTTSRFTVAAGNFMILKGGSVTTTTAGLADFLRAGFTNGGGTVFVDGTDLTAVTGTLLGIVGSSPTADDIINVELRGCELASGVGFTDEDFAALAHQFIVQGSSATSAAAEYQYYLQALGGSVEDQDDTGIHRGDDQAFEDSGTKISYKIDTNTDANLGFPFRFEFPMPRWAELSTAGADTLRFFVASTSALTDKDIFVEVLYLDGTNKNQTNYIATAPTTVGGTLDVLASGTTLTTDSTSDWRDGASALTGHNEYQIDVSTTGDAGADTVPLVRVYVTLPSVTIYLASEYELN